MKKTRNISNWILISLLLVIGIGGAVITVTDTYIRGATDINSTNFYQGTTQVLDTADTVNREVFAIPVNSPGNAANNWYGKLQDDSVESSVYFTFNVPPDFSSIDSAYVYVRAYCTGNVYFACDSNANAGDQSQSGNSDAIAYTTDGVTNNNIALVDVSNCLNNTAASRIVTVVFKRNATDATDTCSGALVTVGLKMKYIANLFYT